jgi:hypothetical protein
MGFLLFPIAVMAQPACDAEMVEYFPYYEGLVTGQKFNCVSIYSAVNLEQGIAALSCGRGEGEEAVSDSSPYEVFQDGAGGCIIKVKFKLPNFYAQLLPEEIPDDFVPHRRTVLVPGAAFLPFPYTPRDACEAAAYYNDEQSPNGVGYVFPLNHATGNEEITVIGYQWRTLLSPWPPGVMERYTCKIVWIDSTDPNNPVEQTTFWDGDSICKSQSTGVFDPTACDYLNWQGEAAVPLTIDPSYYLENPSYLIAAEIIYKIETDLTGEGYSQDPVVVKIAGEECDMAAGGCPGPFTQMAPHGPL